MALKFKRLAASISASIEEVVTKLENHEAVADCLLADLRKGIAQVRVQQNRIQTQANKAAQELEAAEKDIERWNLRALKLASSDEAKALQCVQRAQHSEKTAENLRAQHQTHTEAVDELGARILEMESKLSDLVLKRATLSSRELRAKTTKSVQGADGEVSAEQLFDRWETSVMTDEYASGLDSLTGTPDTDVLDREFRDEENQAELKARLKALQAQSAGNRGQQSKPENDHA